MKKFQLKVIKEFSIILAVFFLIIFSFYSTTTQSLQPHDIYQLNDDWQVYVNQDNQGLINLPATVEAKKNDLVTIQKTLDSNFEDIQTVLIRGSQQSITVKLDGQTIYTKSFEDNIFETHASLFHFIEIPEDSEGKTLEISIRSPFNDFSGVINDLYYGTPSSLQNHLMTTYGPKLTIGLIWFFISLLVIIFNFVFFNKMERYYSYIALFGVFMSLWLMNESRILQLYINNDFLIGSLSYVSIAAAPIAMLAFLKAKILHNDYKILTWITYGFIFNLFLIIVLHMTGILAFFESAMITNIINLLTIIFVLYRILHYYITKKEKYYLLYFMILGIFSIFLTLEIISFLLNDFDSISLYASIGMVVEFFIVLLLSMVIIFNRNQMILKQVAYEEIARTDQLTKAKSRYAFENDMDHYFYQSDEQTAVIYFDFDDLKRINDNFGHNQGDQLLIDGYQKIKEIFEPYGDTYRIGGDEFACISTKITEEDFIHLKYIFKMKVQTLSETYDSMIKISIGYAKEDRSLDEKPSDLIHRADQNMYQDKTKNKTQDK